MNEPKKQRRNKNTTSSSSNATPSNTEMNTINSKIPFPIIGIGSSAGGLEALESFLSNVPECSGLAFVIVQHLDPTRKGIMVELLQRRTTMEVFQVKDGMPIKPDSVYVIPPNKDLSILHGLLYLIDPVQPRGLRLPIDFFFRSMAQDLGENSIGVILSGMGSDGTLGFRAIKEQAGVTFVQLPSSAKFDSMPLSAINAGLADVIAPVEDIPAKILSYVQHTPLIVAPGLPIEGKIQSGIDKILILLRAQTGHDFSLYKKTTINRRIERRMSIHQIERIESYVRLLQENPQEGELLFRELLIGVTSFFRNPSAWEQLKTEVLPELLKSSESTRALRAWVPACSTGEEAYSLAILFKEALQELNNHNFPIAISLQIFASDLDQNAITIAREGVYPANISADILPQRLETFFTKIERGYQVEKSIRDMVIFAPQNLIMDPPFTKLDLICCRNLLIYLEQELQKKLVPLFHYSLNPNGFLFLGSAETIGGLENLFKPLAGKSRLYQRLESGLVPARVEFPSAFFSYQKPRKNIDKLPVNVQALAEKMLLQNYAPAAILTNNKGDILYVNGRTGKYLEPAAGKANWNIFAMIREGMRYKINAGFNKAQKEQGPIKIKNAEVENNGGKFLVDITIQPILSPESLGGMFMIIFNDVDLPAEFIMPDSTQSDTVHHELFMDQERELKHAREELRAMRVEMQTTQEELISTNEELMSTNEELQSTNEELTTSKEEMQSMNEELQTINQELQAKVSDITIVNNDMKNLLDSTDIATLFLDNQLCVRRFTSETSKITHLIPGDIGRPITDIASSLLYPQLADDAREVLRTLIMVEKHIPTNGGAWFSARILPYRTHDNIIDGVVITFMDITDLKKLEVDLHNVKTKLAEMDLIKKSKKT